MCRQSVFLFFDSVNSFNLTLKLSDFETFSFLFKDNSSMLTNS
ncbi:hypothetical protein LFUMFP_120072 [Latilactobacillus fuchuensis]|uniref:Uncharacterized protein n=1 Tax=Latilactobacillus fuchuensis TaxID=164393 RepID=A0A2N9DTJ1_9LACO|nr:hypothetical protein LFUMFP_120072 [Latilactobacillus fuchuensis]